MDSKDILKELREELLAISEGRRSFSIKGVRGCQLLLSKSEETVKFFAQFGADAMSSTPEAGQRRLIDDVETWGRNVEKAKIPKQG